MSDFRFPTEQVSFALNHVYKLPQMYADAGNDEVNAELIEMVVSEAAKLGNDVWAPLNAVGDHQGARLGEQGVEQSPGFKEAYWQGVDAGWFALDGDTEYGGQGLPKSLATGISEIWQSSNLSLSLCPLLTVGTVAAIGRHGDEALKAAFLQKLITGEWTGTMNLTEADAGTDLAAIKTRATPNGDHYLIKGQKIFITWGDHQMTENTIHLVLARLPDAPAGVKGISLFVVPKFLQDDAGRYTKRNDAYAIKVEEKLGIHGSPTCVMAFGEGEGAVGYLVGEANRGLSYMFTMMNDARQAVGHQGVAISERARQQALAYAKDRVQGTLPDGSRVKIIEHPDVRRMLMTITVITEAARLIGLGASVAIDRAELEPSEANEARVQLLTPIVKAWCTETAQETSSLNIQIHGGMGYIEETGAAQHYRDARILPIYEGTTGIQALDLIGRKILADNGVSMAALISDMRATIAACTDSEDAQLNAIEAAIGASIDDLENCVAELVHRSGAEKNNALVGATDLLMGLGYVHGAVCLCQAALAADSLDSSSGYDPQWLAQKSSNAAFFASRILPRAQAHFQAAVADPNNALDFDPEQL